jgi:hypothetical protein
MKGVFMFDITAPKYTRTGTEKTIKDIIAPDKRNLSYSGLSIEDIQAGFLQAEKTLSLNVPQTVKERLVVAKNVAIYGWFSYELYTVSLFWALTTVEMALKHKFYQLNPPPHQITKDGKSTNISASFDILEKNLRKGWRLISLPSFNGSFRSLLEWAVDKNHMPPNTKIILQEIAHSFNNRFILEIFPEESRKKGLKLSDNPTLEEIKYLWDSLSDEEKSGFQYNNAQILIEEIPKLRNELAHPATVNWIFPPRSSIDGYWQVVEILNHLWP